MLASRKVLALVLWLLKTVQLGGRWVSVVIVIFGTVVIFRLWCPTIRKSIQPRGWSSEFSPVQFPVLLVQAPKRSNAKPLLRRLHWLPVEQRITYKTAVLAFKIRNTATPAYLCRHSHLTVCGIFGRLALPCWHDLIGRLISQRAVSVIRRLLSGTHFLRQCLIVRRWHFSNLGWNLTYFTWLTMIDND